MGSPARGHEHSLGRVPRTERGCCWECRSIQEDLLSLSGSAEWRSVSPIPHTACPVQPELGLSVLLDCSPPFGQGSDLYPLWGPGEMNSESHLHHKWLPKAGAWSSEVLRAPVAVSRVQWEENRGGRERVDLQGAPSKRKAWMSKSGI